MPMTINTTVNQPPTHVAISTRAFSQHELVLLHTVLGSRIFRFDEESPPSTRSVDDAHYYAELRALQGKLDRMLDADRGV